MQLKEAWQLAYNCHYKAKSSDDKKKALSLYRQIIKSHPDSEEAKYSQSQIENLSKSNPELFENEETESPTESTEDISISKDGCVVCGTVKYSYSERGMCSQCFAKYLFDNIIMTTTNNVDGYTVAKYIDIKSVEIVIGTGLFSENISFIQDIFGLRSTLFEGKLADAKRIATEQLRYEAYKIGGNAVVGVDIDYTEFSGNRVGLIINGTVVIINKISNENQGLI